LCERKEREKERGFLLEEGRGGEGRRRGTEGGVALPPFAPPPQATDAGREAFGAQGAARVSFFNPAAPRSVSASRRGGDGRREREGEAGRRLSASSFLAPVAVCACPEHARAPYSDAHGLCEPRPWFAGRRKAAFSHRCVCERAKCVSLSFVLSLRFRACFSAFGSL
jgi:hypothetical protein